ncbi:MAG: gamma carbonic anhydrase family protein [Candidatus Nanopelagicales bacterium]|nr:gamma carbonic anhydrase family protein [Candidatus Nanopelagicales bacterium]
MPLYAIGDRTPTIDPTAFVHPDAVLIGDVVVGPESSIWPTAVLRGDSGRIVVGARTSIQDGSVLHCTSQLDTVVGDRCVVGHRVHLEGCTLEDDSLAGSGSVVLHGAVVRSWGFVAAGAVVAPGTEVPGGAMAMGVPARIRPDAAPRHLIESAVQTYAANAHWYNAELRRLG